MAQYLIPSTCPITLLPTIGSLRAGSRQVELQQPHLQMPLFQVALVWSRGERNPTVHGLMAHCNLTTQITRKGKLYHSALSLALSRHQATLIRHPSAATISLEPASSAIQHFSPSIPAGPRMQAARFPQQADLLVVSISQLRMLMRLVSPAVVDLIVAVLNVSRLLHLM